MTGLRYFFACVFPAFCGMIGHTVRRMRADFVVGGAACEICFLFSGHCPGRRPAVRLRLKDEPRASVESVVQENWPQFSDAEYDETAGTLRLTQESTMTYASAQKFGGEVYKDDLSLESYLDIVGVISYDVRSACGLQELTVTRGASAATDRQSTPSAAMERSRPVGNKERRIRMKEKLRMLFDENCGSSCSWACSTRSLATGLMFPAV